jgi:hypothetical protein
VGQTPEFGIDHFHQGFQRGTVAAGPQAEKPGHLGRRVHECPCFSHTIVTRGAKVNRGTAGSFSPGHAARGSRVSPGEQLEYTYCEPVNFRFKYLVEALGQVAFLKNMVEKCGWANRREEQCAKRRQRFQG